MSRRAKRRTVNDMDDLLPSELIETTKGSTITELSDIITSLENQMKEMVEKYKGEIEDLNSRLESIEKDFKQVVEALKTN